MKQIKGQNLFPRMTVSIVFVTVSMMILMSLAFKAESTNNIKGRKIIVAKDSLISVSAFMEVYKVLMSPRCMNCHPAGENPLQGDDSHPHVMLPQRGKDGKGISAMKCSNCHQDTNVEGLNQPPGHPEWHLPPANMKMVFEGKSPEQLAKQLVNPKTNGNKSLMKLMEHADDGLVKAGWNPGEGRTVPPLTHEEFKKAWTTWIENGAYAPRSQKENLK